MESDATSGLSDVAIEAGIDAWEEAEREMGNYVSGVSRDWDSGMIVAHIYKAVRAAVEAENE